MSNLSPPPSYLAISVSLVPKLTAVVFLYAWLTGASSAPVGKLCLVFGVLAFLDAVTLASLRKGSVAIEWPDISLILGCLIGPAILPLYTALLVGVIALGGNDGPETKRMLGGPSQERLANSPPTRFAAPTRPNPGGMVQTNPGNGPGVNVNANANAGTNPNGNRGPLTPGMPPQAGAQRPPNGVTGGPPSGNTVQRPAFGSPPRPVVAPTTSQRPLVKDAVTPASAAPVVVNPSTSSAPAPAPVAVPATGSATGKP